MTPKLCYQCENFYISIADCGYSEFTPGTDWGMSCTKNVWNFDPFEDDVNKFRACLETAQRCKKFETRFEAGRGKQ